MRKLAAPSKRFSDIFFSGIFAFRTHKPLPSKFRRNNVVSDSGNPLVQLFFVLFGHVSEPFWWLIFPELLKIWDAYLKQLKNIRNFQFFDI